MGNGDVTVSHQKYYSFVPNERITYFHRAIRFRTVILISGIKRVVAGNSSGLAVDQTQLYFIRAINKIMENKINFWILQCSSSSDQ